MSSKAVLNDRRRGGGRRVQPGRGADHPREGGSAWASWTRGFGGDARIVDILISAAYALGVVESLRDRVAQLHVVEDLPQGLRHLDRAIESLVSAGSVIGCGTPRPVTIRRAAR